MIYTKDMKLLVFYRPDSEHARKVTDYLRELDRHHGVGEGSVELIDVDTSEGDNRAKIYDVMAYPTCIVTDETGGFIKLWSGELPLQNELASYLFRR